MSGREYTDKVEKHYTDGVITRLNYQRVMGDVYDSVFSGNYESDAYDKIETVLKKLGWVTKMVPVDSTKYQEMLEWQYPSRAQGEVWQAATRRRRAMPRVGEARESVSPVIRPYDR